MSLFSGSVFRFTLSLSLTFISAIALVSLVSQVTSSNPVTSLSPALSQNPFPDPVLDISPTNTKGRQTLVLAGGCFWGMEAVFEHLEGVTDVVSGYSGGDAATANYETINLGTTGHAEAIEVTYDPTKISYGQLLKVYFLVAHDPTQLNRQGPDHGSQYRSAIFFRSQEQQRVAQAYINQLNAAQAFTKPIVTQLAPLDVFYAAEDYHQNFIKHNPINPYVIIHDLPKLKQLKKRFAHLYRD